MAVYREAPKCIHCGKVIAKAKYESKEHFLGDTFIGWEYIEHNCEKKIKLIKEKKEEWDRLFSNIEKK